MSEMNKVFTELHHNVAEGLFVFTELHHNVAEGLFVFSNVVSGNDRLCGLVFRVSGNRYRGLGFDSRRYQIF